ncbi:MAG: single-stranded DNA-binding protein [Spirochaetota bacterium]
MADINRVTLVGRLVRDADVKVTQGGMQITKFGIAINRRRKQGDQWVDEANFFDIVIFGRMGEAVSRYLTKGKQVGVDGELVQNRWEQDGQTRSKVEIFCNNIQLLGGRGDGAGPGGSSTGASTGASRGGNEPFGGAGSGPADPVDDFEDDVPF